MRKQNRRVIAAATMVGILTSAVLAGCSQSSSQSSSETEAAATTAQAETEAESDTAGTEAETEAEITYPKMQIDTACNNPNSPDEEFLKKFGELIEEKSGGQITSVIFAGTLGSETEIVEQIRSGTIHIYPASSATVSAYAQAYNTFSIPYLYADKEQVMNSWYSSIGEGLRNAWKEAGIGTSANTLFIRGMRELTSNKLITCVDDIRGLKLRLPSTQEWVTVWSKLGANVATISSSEVFSALQTGVVDAQENPIISNYGKGLQEVQKYTIMTDHLVDFLPVVYSQSFYDGLDENTQELLIECIDEATEWANQYCIDVTESNKEEMEAAGMEFHDIDTTEFKEVAMSCVPELSEAWADGVYDQLMIDTQ